MSGVIILTQCWRKDLVGLYTGVNIGYGILVVLYSYLVLSSERCEVQGFSGTLGALVRCPASLHRSQVGLPRSLPQRTPLPRR